MGSESAEDSEDVEVSGLVYGFLPSGSSLPHLVRKFLPDMAFVSGLDMDPV